MDDLRSKVEAFKLWYHRIDFGDGIVTRAAKDQTLVFALYEPWLPDLNGLRVLDLGANACALSIEFAKRGAHVVAVDTDKYYIGQARFVVEAFGLSDRVEIHDRDLYSIRDLGVFDIVCCVGVLYHLRHYQLGLDLAHHALKDGGHALISCQTTPGETANMRARYSKGPDREIMGWEPTQRILRETIIKAGFDDVTLMSSAPHALESPGRVLGNRNYFAARGTDRKPVLPFVDSEPVGR